MQVVDFLRRFSDGLDLLIKRIVFLTIVGMIVSISLQIIFRVFFESLTWTEELSRYLLVWSTFLGATMAYKRGMHISVTFVIDAFPSRFKKIVTVSSIVLSLVFFVISINFGIKLMTVQIFQISPALRLPMRWVYVGIPISFFIMLIHGLTAALEELLKNKEGGGE